MLDRVVLVMVFVCVVLVVRMWFSLVGLLSSFRVCECIGLNFFMMILVRFFLKLL